VSVYLPVGRGEGRSRRETTAVNENLEFGVMFTKESRGGVLWLCVGYLDVSV